MEAMERSVRHELPGGQPLFRLLFDLAKHMDARQLRLRIIGGMALYFMHRQRNSNPRTTADLDCAFPAEEWSSAEAARPKVLGLVSVLRDDLGLKRDPSEKGRASRTSRFTYGRPNREERIEILCGKLSFGERSKRLPAWRLMEDESGNMVYASKVDWIDLVPEWISIEIAQGEATTHLEIPGLAGMMVLKLKAVVDKLERVQEERKAERKDHEFGRLQRHAGDLICLVEWARSTPGAFREYQRVVDSSDEVRERSRRLRAWILEEPSGPEFKDLFEQLREVAGDL